MIKRKELTKGMEQAIQEIQEDKTFPKLMLMTRKSAKNLIKLAFLHGVNGHQKQIIEEQKRKK